MGSKPILELDRLDLDRVVVPKEEIYRVLPHRHEMALLDGLLHFDRERGEAVGFHDVRDDEFWVRGHIPGRPIMPGVLMVEAAGQVAGYAFEHLQPGEPGRFFGFAALDGVRFRGIVVPGDRLLLVAAPRRVRANFGQFAVQGYVKRRRVLDVTITGMVIPPETPASDEPVRRS